MGKPVGLLLVCLFVVSVYGMLDPNQMEVAETQTRSFAIPRDVDDEACATAQLNFFWGNSFAQERGSSRIANIYFFPNGTFNDISYAYRGTWAAFGENGDDIMVFDYPSARYVSPSNDGTGSMISHGVCGYWFFQGFKWYCPSNCAN